MAGIKLLIEVDDKGSPVVSKFDENVGKTGHTAEKAKGGFLSLGQSISVYASGIESALRLGGRFVSYLSEFAELGLESDKIYHRLSGSVDSMGVSYTKVEKPLSTYFNKLQEVSRYSDEESAQAFDKLSNLTGSYEKSVKNLPLVLDIASSGMVDLSTAAKIVGDTLAGSGESAAQLVPELKTMTRDLMSAARAAGEDGAAAKFRIAEKAMQMLTERFGGRSQQDLESWEGKLKNVGNEWSEIKEQIGKQVLEFVFDEANFETIIKTLKWIMDLVLDMPAAFLATGSAIATLTGNILGYASAMVDNLGPVTKMLLEFIGIDLSSVSKGLSDAGISALDMGKKMDGMGVKASEMAENMKASTATMVENLLKPKDSADKFAKTLITLQGNAIDAADKIKDLGKKTDKTGISIKDIVGKSKKMEDGLKALSEKGYITAKSADFLKSAIERIKKPVVDNIEVINKYMKSLVKSGDLTDEQAKKIQESFENMGGGVGSQLDDIFQGLEGLGAISDEAAQRMTGAFMDSAEGADILRAKNEDVISKLVDTGRISKDMGEKLSKAYEDPQNAMYSSQQIMEMVIQDMVNTGTTSYDTGSKMMLAFLSGKSAIDVAGDSAKNLGNDIAAVGDEADKAAKKILSMSEKRNTLSGGYGNNRLVDVGGGQTVAIPGGTPWLGRGSEGRGTAMELFDLAKSQKGLQGEWFRNLINNMSPVDTQEYWISGKGQHAGYARENVMALVQDWAAGGSQWRQGYGKWAGSAAVKGKQADLLSEAIDKAANISKGFERNEYGRTSEHYATFTARESRLNELVDEYALKGLEQTSILRESISRLEDSMSSKSGTSFGDVNVTVNGVGSGADWREITRNQIMPEMQRAQERM